MILNLWTNFEFSSLWNYHFTLYALKCKKSIINGCKIECHTPVDLPSCRCRKIVLDWFLSFRLRPLLGSTESRFLCLCVEVNILCKHVKMCVCVCAQAYSWIWQWGWKTRDLESPPIIRKLKVWLVTYIYLVLLSWLRYAWKPGLEPKMDSGIWLCEGKVLSTPRHPSMDGYLPPCALICVWSIKWMLDITRHKCPNVVGHTSIGDAHIRRSRFCYPLFPFRISYIV